LLEALVNIVNDMPNYIQQKDGISWISNPVNPLENFADKWQEYPQRKMNFRHWLQQVRTDLNTALESKSINAIGESMKPHFGERVINEALKHFSTPGVATSKSLIMGATRLPSRFNVPHRQTPRWPVTEQGWVSITGWASCKGFRPWQIQNDSSPLPKHCSLRFEAQTNIPWPYKVYWQVVNTGYEAKIASCLRGGFYEGIIEKGGRVREESTLYTGMHWIECFIIKNGVCVARSGEFVVNIE